MRITQCIRVTAASGLLSLVLAGGALAADDSASLNLTGPNSNNQVTDNQSSDLNVNNTNNVTVTNTNNQTASSGAATVTNNTIGGGASSGNVSNNNAVETSINIGNGGATVAATNPVVTTGSGSAGLPSIPGMGAATAASTPGSGSAGFTAAPGMGGGALPAVGCQVTCDVSALRAAYHPATTGLAKATQQTRGVQAGLLGLAALLSLVGAGGSAIFAAKRAKVTA